MTSWDEGEGGTRKRAIEGLGREKKVIPEEMA